MPRNKINENIKEIEEKESEIENLDGELIEEENDLIFEGGPSKKEINDWKEKYKHIYFTPFDDEVFVWKVLERREYRGIIANKDLSPLDREEVFVQQCVLYPRNYTKEKMTEGKAGIPSLLAEMIMEKSGFIAQSAPIKL
jgi:hypothetical protein